MNSKDVWKQVRKSKKTYYEDSKIRHIEDNFKDNINYEQVYKNFDPEDIYDTWIYDFHSEKKDSEEKYIQMYPYQTIKQGEYIFWKEEPWICMGVDLQYEYKQLGMMYKCLEYPLKWIDQNGLHSYPIWSQSKVLRDPLADGRPIVLIESSMELYVQRNEDTLSIKPNDRFIFGQRTVFRVLETIDFYIDGILKVMLKKDEENHSKDDFINGIAFNDYNTKVVLAFGSVEGDIGEERFLQADVEINGVVDGTKVITWSSANTSVATVDQTGKVVFVGYGVADIVAEYNGITGTVTVLCTNTGGTDIEYRITPSVTTVSVGESQIFTVEKYVNTILEPVTFTFVASSGDFDFEVVDGNTYKVINISEKYGEVVVEATEGLNTETFNHKLRAW